MTTKTLPAGSLKLIIGNVHNASRNRGRDQGTLQAQSVFNAEARTARISPKQARPARLLPAYLVLVLDDAGQVSESYSANIAPCEATLCYSAHGLAKCRPGTAAEMRSITDECCFFWAEIVDEITIEIVE